jgi:hypothetical protein
MVSSLTHTGITITSGVEEMAQPNSRRPSHGDITITSGVEEMAQPNSRRTDHRIATIISNGSQATLKRKVKLILLLNKSVFWDIALFTPVNVDRRFR